MLKKLIRFIRSTPTPDASGPDIIPRDHHPISRKDISPNALKVLYRLNSAGYDAFLVGGGVRDILLGLHPKDFDIATNATPEQVKQQFGNCRLIGRRFRLAHVRFGREIIEVATFRADHDKHAEKDKRGSTGDEGQILRDNVYGNQEEDALRRDFTVNALYYSVKDFSIYDYAQGLKDLEQRTLRLIGDPEKRYREDPVRMLRAARFAAKLKFEIAKPTRDPILELGSLLTNIPSARLFEEVLKLFLSGQALETYQLLRDLKLFRYLFPATDSLLEKGHPHAEALITQALRNTDARINADKPVTPAFLYAALLWSPVQVRMEAALKSGQPPMQALHQASQEIIEAQIRHTALPKRFSIPMKEIWELQLRLPKTRSRNLQQLASHPRFRAAYDFVLLRESSGEQLNNIGDFWTKYQEKHGLPQPKREQTDSSGREPQGEDGRSPGRRRRRPRRRKPRSDQS